jgi:putative transposase
MLKPNRKSIRLPGYDYARAGWYFVTICCHNRQHIFGEIVAGRIAYALHRINNPL